MKRAASAVLCITLSGCASATVGLWPNSQPWPQVGSTVYVSQLLLTPWKERKDPSVPLESYRCTTAGKCLYRAEPCVPMTVAKMNEELLTLTDARKMTLRVPSHIYEWRHVIHPTESTCRAALPPQ